MFHTLFFAFILFIARPSFSDEGGWAATYWGTNPDRTQAIQQTKIGAGDASSSEDWDFCVLKLTAEGTIEWQKTYGGEKWEIAESVQQTREGGYIVAGFTRTFGAGWWNLWVLRLRPGGTVKWQKTYGGIYNDRAHSVQQTTDGGYILAGMTSSFSAGEAELWVLKLREDGMVEWQKAYGGVTHDEAEAVRQTSDGGYIVAGWTRSFGAGKSDIWVLKLAADGVVEWHKTYGGIDYDRAEAVQQTRDGGYIVAGMTTSFGAGDKDIWVLKLRPDGTPEWQATYGGIDTDTAECIQQTLDGGYIVAGYTKSFGTGEGDLWVLKLRPDGTPEWQKTYGGSNGDVAHSIHETSDGGYIVAGYTGSFGGSDLWVLKLKPDGTVEWQKAYGGVNPYIANSIRQTRDGGYIVAGEVWFSNIREDLMFLKSRLDGSRDFIVKDTNVTILDTSARVVNSNISPRDTWATVQDTDVSARLLVE